MAYTGEKEAFGRGKAILQVIKSIETEAKAAGARSLIIRGEKIVEKGFLGISRDALRNLGYEMNVINNETFTIIKKL